MIKSGGHDEWRTKYRMGVPASESALAWHKQQNSCAPPSHSSGVCADVGDFWHPPGVCLRDFLSELLVIMGRPRERFGGGYWLRLCLSLSVIYPLSRQTDFDSRTVVTDLLSQEITRLLYSGPWALRSTSLGSLP